MPRSPASLPSGARISDYVTLGVLTTTVPGELIDAVLAATGRESRRQRQLPARLVVYYVMALALYAQASYGEVLRCLLEGVRWLRLGGADVALAGKSAITQARTRLGAAPLKELFARVARPFAEPGLPGAWYRGRRLVSLDGTTIDLPDTPELEARFGRPGASRGTAAFPSCVCSRSPRPARTRSLRLPSTAMTRARSAWRRSFCSSCASGMLCLADRAFVGFELWRTASASGADLFWRVRANQILPCRERLADGSYLSRLYASPKHRRHDEGGLVVRVIDYRLDGVPDAEPLYRLITTLLEPDTAPAAELAALYHERWESEGAFAELKVALPGKRLMLRSRRADLAEQELYGLRAGASRAAAADGRRQPPGRLRPRHAVLPPHGADRPPPSAVPRRVFPLAGAAG